MQHLRRGIAPPAQKFLLAKAEFLIGRSKFQVKISEYS